MELIIEFILEMVAFFNEMAIYLIFGFGIAGLLHIFFPENLVHKHLGKSNFGSVLKSSLFGIPIPICSCGVIPVASSLRKKGASKGATISFLISTPQIGADSFMITYSLIGWIFGIFRILAAFLTAMFAGIFTNIFDSEGKDNTAMSHAKVADSAFSHRLKTVLKYIQFELFGAIANHMLIGIIIAGMITVFIPESFFEAYLSNQFLSMLIMLIIGIPMYVCATSSTPIAASLIMKGISPGAALVFLLAGPATNAVTISTVSKSLGKKTTTIYLLSIAIVSVILGYVLNILVAQNKIPTMQHMHHEMLPNWIQYFGSFLLLGMFFLHYFISYMNKKKFQTKHAQNTGNQVLNVQGMTCNHCKASVMKAVQSVNGTNNINVDLEKGNVFFNFKKMDLSEIKKAIQEKGFEVMENKKVEFIVEGMNCSHCKASVTKAISTFNTKNININLNTKKVQFECEDENVNKIKEAIQDSGFEVKTVSK